MLLANLYLKYYENVSFYWVFYHEPAGKKSSHSVMFLSPENQRQSPCQIESKTTGTVACLRAQGFTVTDTSIMQPVTRIVCLDTDTGSVVVLKHGHIPVQNLFIYRQQISSDGETPSNSPPPPLYSPDVD